MFLSLDNLQLRYEPFPIGVIRPIMPEERYASYIESYPPINLFEHVPKVGHKYCLSEKYNREQYMDWVSNTPVWKEFYRWIKSDEFVLSVLHALSERYIDLGFRQRSASAQITKHLRHLLRGKRWSGEERLSARFDFSILPADGGMLKPHTDNMDKIVTIVVSMVRPGEWDPAIGGDLDVNQPKDVEFAFNRLNRKADFPDMNILHSYEFSSNQAILFVKTFNSWHSVRPMTATGSNAMRRTLTINIEKRN